MRAVRQTTLSGADGLTVVDDAPVPSDPRDVIIEVHAAGVGFPDLLMTQGKYQVRPEPPFSPGVEVAGVVRSAPEGSGLAPGDRVAASSKLGAWAEVAAANPPVTFKIPDAMSFAEATAMVNYQTAEFAFGERTVLRDGETVLIVGAAGGTGTAAIDVARARGATVIAVARGEEKLEACRQLGAHHAFDNDSDWLAEVRKLTDNRGVDVVYDPVGGEKFLDAVRALAIGGRLLVIGFTGGIPEMKTNRLLLRNTSLIGVAWGEYIRHDPAMPRRVGASLDALYTAGKLKPLVGVTFPLDRAADALREIESRRAIGKIVLQVR
jgi:NADPH2:quinone reductase